jgi:hypothetical protein
LFFGGLPCPYFCTPLFSQIIATSHLQAPCHPLRKALIVKLADRITNTEFNLQNDSIIYQVYHQEFPQFQQLLYREEDVDLQPMWKKLISLNHN